MLDPVFIEEHVFHVGPVNYGCLRLSNGVTLEYIEDYGTIRSSTPIGGTGVSYQRIVTVQAHYPWNEQLWAVMLSEYIKVRDMRDPKRHYEIPI